MLIVKEDRKDTTMTVEKDKKKMKSIILYLDNMAAINCLSDASAGRIFKSILEYANTGILPELEEEGIKALFMMFAAQIDRDTEAYITNVRKCRECPQTLQDKSANERMRRQTTASKRLPK